MLYQKTCALVANAWTDATVHMAPERVADETACRALFEELFSSVGDVTACGAAQAQCLFRLSSLVDFLVIWGSSMEQSGVLLSECWRDVLSFMIDRRAVAEETLVQSMPRAELNEPHARYIVEHVRENINRERAEGKPSSKLLFQVGLWCCDRTVREQVEGELVLEMMPTKRPEAVALRADDELCALVLARGVLKPLLQPRQRAVGRPLLLGEGGQRRLAQFVDRGLVLGHLGKQHRLVLAARLVLLLEQ